MRFRFTIRDLLWLVVVVALAVGWGYEHRRVNRRLEQIESALWSIDSTQRNFERTADYLLRRSGLDPKPSPPRGPILQD